MPHCRRRRCVCVNCSGFTTALTTALYCYVVNSGFSSMRRILQRSNVVTSTKTWSKITYKKAYYANENSCKDKTRGNLTNLLKSGNCFMEDHSNEQNLQLLYQKGIGDPEILNCLRNIEDNYSFLKEAAIRWQQEREVILNPKIQKEIVIN